MPLIGVDPCHHCGSLEHWDLQESCPERKDPKEGATNRKAHEARIDKYIEWCNGELPLLGRITPYQKQQLIKQENERYRKAVAKERKAS